MTMKMKAQHYKNAADPEFPATDLANAPARAEFKLGIFPPDHHVPPAAPDASRLRFRHARKRCPFQLRSARLP